jgi:hypothetical protein
MDKVIGYVLGAFIRLVPFLRQILGGTTPKLGCTVSNIPGDFELTNKFKAKLMRVDYEKGKLKTAAKFAQQYGLDYYVQIGQKKLNYKDNARLIQKAEAEIAGYPKKPLFFSVINEDNEFSWDDFSDIENEADRLGVKAHITKGAYTSIAESSGFASTMRDFKLDHFPYYKKHVIHFYLKYEETIFDKFENFLRLNLLYYVVARLKLKGVDSKNICIGESHDATDNICITINESERRPFTKNGDRFDGDLVLHKLSNNRLRVRRYEGDLVYATNQGWKKLTKNAQRLGVGGLLYYAAPFLSYDHNTVLK